MSNKQILSAIQIESDEIRLLTGEYYNDCLYVLDTQIEKCDGLQNHNIVDKSKVCACINTALKKANMELGTNIKKVILAIPSYRVAISSQQFFNEYEQNHIISKDDIKYIHNSGFNYSLGSDYEVINVMCNNYVVNGLVQRKPPIGLRMSHLNGELQLIGCDKLMTYSYADVIEKCNLEIIDVCLDMVASAKETALLENAYQNYVVAINIEKNQSSFTLAYKGKIVSTDVINFGYESLSRKITETFSIPLRKSDEIVFKFLDLNKEELTETAVFVWRYKEEVNQITEKQLFETIKPELDYLCSEYETLCQQIFQFQNVNVQLTGAGSIINGLAKYLQRCFNKQVNEYVPNILGARDTIWTVPLGLIYNYLDNNQNSEVNSIDLIQFEEGLKPVKKEKTISVTGKIKDLFSEDINQEED